MKCRSPGPLLAVCIALFTALGAHAQMLTPGGPNVDLLNLQGTIFPGANGDPTITDFKLHSLIPIARSDTDSWSASLYGANLHLTDPLTLSSGARTRNLWSVNASVNYGHSFSGGRALGLSFGVGSESDKPFHSINETAIDATGTYRFPAWGHDEWLLGVNFNTNRPALNDIPIPIFGYLFHRPEHGIEGALGFPFAVFHWQIDPLSDLSLSYIFPASVKAELGRRVGPVRIKGGFYWEQELWAIADRPDTSQRLFFDVKKLAAGIGVPLFWRVALDASGSYAFDRAFYNGTQVFSRDGEVSLRAAWFGMLTLKIPLGSRP